MLAPGELTIEDGCLASSLGLDPPWWRTVQGMRRSWCWNEATERRYMWAGGRYARCKVQDAGAALDKDGERE